MRSLAAFLRRLTLPFGAGPNTPAIDIGTGVPPEITAFYALAGETVVSGIIKRNDSSNYIFDGLVLSIGVPTSVRCVVTGGGVQEVERINHFFGGLPTVVLGNFTSVLLQLGTPLSPSNIDVWGSVDVATPRTVRVFQNTASNNSAAAYGFPTNPAEVDFIAPLSGTVIIQWMARVHNDNINGDTRVVPEVYEGTIAAPGAVSLAASDVRATQWQQPGIINKQMRCAGVTRHTGMVGSDPYFATIAFRAVAGTGTSTIDDIELIVSPAH